MVCYGGGHVKIMAPLYHHLKDTYEITILALTTAGNYLKARNIPYKSFSSFSELLTDEVFQYGNELKGDITNDFVSEEETVAYLGVSFKELVEKFDSYDEAKKELSLKGRSIFLPVKTLMYIINQVKPDLVMTTNVARAELAALKAAKIKRIPSICINDNLWIEGGAKNVAQYNLCDVLCVISKEVKDDLLRQTTFPKEKISVTGTPVFDEIKKLPSTKKKNKRPVILLADCELPETNPRFPDGYGDINFGPEVRGELDRLAKLNGWDVVFRPHPNQKYDYKLYENIRISSSKELIHSLLLSVNVVVTAISTVGIEGKMLGCGLVSLEGTVYQAAGSYAQLKLSTGVFSAEQLHQAVLKELDQESNKRIELFEGCSLDNIKVVVDSLLSELNC